MCADVWAEDVRNQILNLKREIETPPEELKTGVFGMKFMTKSIERRKKEAQEARRARVLHASTLTSCRRWSS